MLDFRMKHEGEPPARLLAQVQARLGEGYSTIDSAGNACTRPLPKVLASVLVPFMETVDDLDPEFLKELGAIVRLLERRGVSPEVGMAELQKVIDDLVATATGEESEDEAEINAWNSTRPVANNSLYQKFAKRLIKINKDGSPAGHPLISNIGPRYQGHSGRGQRETLIAGLADGLLARVDRKHEPTIGRAYANMTMGEMAMHSLRAEGHRPMNAQDAIRMATHTTTDFSYALESALGKSVARQMEQVKPALTRAAHEVPALDYRGGNLVGLSGSGMPQEIGEGGEINYVTIDESGERKPTPRDFGSMFGLSNKAIANDDLGIFDQIGKKMVLGASERFRHVLLEPLLANGGMGNLMRDGKTVFHADHGNLAAAGADLNITSLSNARIALRSQRGSQGEYYSIEPWALVVPPQLETQAQQLMSEINATKFTDANPFSGALEVIVEVALTDQNAWYLIGNPSSHDGLAYSFLDGQAAPHVESKPGWNTLGVEFRLVWALDARFVSAASWYKNPGL